MARADLGPRLNDVNNKSTANGQFSPRATGRTATVKMAGLSRRLFNIDHPEAIPHRQGGIGRSKDGEPNWDLSDSGNPLILCAFVPAAALTEVALHWPLIRSECVLGRRRDRWGQTVIRGFRSPWGGAPPLVGFRREEGQYGESAPRAYRSRVELPHE